MTVDQAIRQAAIDRLDAEVLLAHVLKKDRAWLAAHAQDRVSGVNFEAFSELVTQRRDGQPVAYLVGVKEFYGREFRVSPDVLIPRPETEELVEHVLDDLPSSPIIVDIGTGSGCLAITLALEAPQATTYAIDVSAAALAIAKQNAQQLNAKVAFWESDLWPAKVDLPAAERTVVVANLPYVSDAEYYVSPSIQAEPELALRGGRDGLDVIVRLIEQFQQANWQPAHLWLEIDPSQWKPLQPILPGISQAYPDLSGRIRFIETTPL